MFDSACFIREILIFSYLIQMLKEHFEKPTETKEIKKATINWDGIPLSLANQAGRAQEPIVNKKDMLFGNFMKVLMVENELSIVHPSYGHTNFQFQLYVISLFSNTIPIYGKTDENPYSHVAWSVENIGNFKYKGMSAEVIRIRLWVHTLKDKASEWVETL